VLARIVGFGRIVVFAGAVGYRTVGDIYQAVNTIPNIVFEIVAGGALAAVVVPLLAGAVERRDAEGRKVVDQTTSALLSWALLVLTPLALGFALAAGPIVSLLIGPEAAAGTQGEFGRLLLRVFAPQLVLYGVGVVLTGVLQAHRRFAGPALAPLLSSITVVATYLLYGWLQPGTPAQATTSAQLVLAVGTTLGVVVLSLSLLMPLRGTGVRIRPSLSFPPGAVGRARRLIGSGVAALIGQQLTQLVALLLAKRWEAPEGSVVAFTMAQTVFLLPWAVLAVPLATSAYPRLAAAWERGDAASYRRTLRTTTQGVLALTGFAVAALIAGAWPVATLVTTLGDGSGSRRAVALGIALFAPGLLGFGLFALLSRALYATGKTGAAARAVLAGWGVAALCDVGFGFALPADDRVLALAAGNTAGMTVLGIALLAMVARQAGAEAFTGTGRLAVTLIPATVLAAAAGAWLAGIVPGSGAIGAVGQGAAAAAGVLLLFWGIFLGLGRLVGAPTAVPLPGLRKRRTPEEGENA
jgi:putative peptidoglycan lipid II flippase